MQRSIQGKVLSLFLTLLLSLGTFAVVVATVWVASPMASAQQVDNYEINFATNGTTITENGITATVTTIGNEVLVYNRYRTATNYDWMYDYVEINVQLSGQADYDGLLDFDLNSINGRGTSFYVQEGQSFAENIKFIILVNANPEKYHPPFSDDPAALINLELTSEFEPCDVYTLTPPAPKMVNGVTVKAILWDEDVPSLVGEGAGIAPGLEIDGTATAQGRYTIVLSSVKSNFNGTFTTDVIPAGYDNIWYDLEYDMGAFIMPAQDVDDIVFTVTFNPSGSGGGGSSGGGSSGGSGNNSTPVTPTPAPVNSTQAVKNVKDAIAAAKNTPNGAAVNLQNVTTVSLDTIKQMVKAAGNTALKVNADSLNPDGSIDVRITFDPSKATTALNLSASTTSIEAQIAQNTFAKHFDNNISTVSLSQKGSFGTPVRVAAKVDTKLNPETLVFYSYDSVTNTFTKIENPQYKVDKNGYVHFTTSVGGEIIISDKPLKKK